MRSWEELLRRREHGGDVALACNRTTLVRLLNMTGVDRIVTVAAGVDEAVTALGSEDAIATAYDPSSSATQVKLDGDRATNAASPRPAARRGPGPTGCRMRGDR